MKKKMIRNALWLVFLVIGTFWIITNQQKKLEYHKIQGSIFGTIYAIKYQSDEDIQSQVTEELNRFDYSLSPFKESSVISKVNRNEEVELDSLFINVFKRSEEISQISNGSFDITVAPLVNAWGFGFKQGSFPDSLAVDSLLQHTGFSKIKLIDNKIIKEDPSIILNASAIAKGYAVDIIGDLLKRKDIKNFMIDIGGEILAQGVNPEGELWKIGINKPIDDPLAVNQDLELVVKLKDKALATSGNYRNFYIKEGKKYAHTIDPKSGYPVQHNILSATVLADDCMTADALATTFMVVGFEESLEILKKFPEVEACFILSDIDDKYKLEMTDGFKKLVLE